MEKLARRTGAAVFLLCVPLTVGAADLSQLAPLSDPQWDKVYVQVGLLDEVAYFPSLLPVIMKHRDTIGRNRPPETVLTSQPLISSV